MKVGFSPCPNDTLMFHGLVAEGTDFIPVIEDIEALNQRALSGDRLPVTKLSLPALAQLTEHYTVLSVGAALGRGCGPLVVAPRGCSLGELQGKRIAIPGEATTAAILLRTFLPDFEAVVLRFDEIMPAVAQGRVDAGTVIHEGRFTFQDHGLAKVDDLGELWEAEVRLPLPLGVIAALRDLGESQIQAVEDGLRRSVQAGLSDPESCWDYVRKHSQELSDDVCRQHIELYVNEFSIELGAEGRGAIDEMLRHCGCTASPWR